MANINQLPYYLINNTYKTNQIAKFLLKKVKKLLKEKCPYHYLVFQRKDKMLKIIQDKSKKYPYFLRFDIEKYYPSINHEILLDILRKILKSRQGQKLLKTEILPFLNKIGIQNKGLPLGNYLSYVLAGIYLLPLDIKLIKLNKPFLRVQDDYLVFCKNKKEPERILKEIIEPELNKLELKININKLNSGKFHQNPVEFMGFRYYAGVFTISEKKIEEFKKKIIKLTYLTKKKPEKAVIKSLNNQILGFGHYYKFANCKRVYEELDAFIRMRLRRYLSRNKNSKNREGNLLLTNETLKNLGLKSLLEIKEKYASKKKHIFRKKARNKAKTGEVKKSPKWTQFEDFEFKYQQKLILSQLKQLTNSLNKVEKRLTNLEQKLVTKDNNKKSKNIRNF